MAITRISANYYEDWSGGSNTTSSTAGTFALAANNTVVLMVTNLDAGTITSVTDSAGNTYSLVGSFTDPGGFKQFIYLCPKANPHATNVVTVTWSAGVRYRALAAIQYACDGGGMVEAFSAIGTGAVYGGGGREITVPAFATTVSDTVMVFMPRFGITGTYTYPVDASGGTPTAVTSGSQIKWAELFLAAPRASATASYRQSSTNANFDGLAVVVVKIAGLIPAGSVVRPPRVIQPLVRVQSTPPYLGYWDTTTLTFPAPLTVGNAVVVTLFLYGNVSAAAFALISVTDTSGANVYLPLFRQSASSATVLMWLCRTVDGTASPLTITIYHPQQYTYQSAIAVEVGNTGSGGWLAVDQTVGRTTSGTGATTPTTVALTGDNAFLLSALTITGAQSAITVESVTPAWRQEFEQLAWSSEMPGEVDTRTLANVLGSTQACAWTYTNSATYSSVLAVFTEGVGPPPPNLAPARLSQLPVEVLALTAAPSLRLSQAPVETLVLSDVPVSLRVSQLPVEALVQSTAAVDLRVSQLPVEVLVRPLISGQIAQLPVEVLVLPTPTTVPNVVGLSVSAATTALITAGLVAGEITQVFHATLATGLVISTAPIAGTSVLNGTIVPMLVSLGSPVVPAYDLTIVQRTGTVTSSSGSAITITFPSPPMVGNAIVVFAGVRSTSVNVYFPSGASILDNKDNSFTRNNGASGFDGRTYGSIFSCTRVTQTGPDYAITLRAWNASLGTPILSGTVFYSASAIEVSGVGLALEYVSSNNASNSSGATTHTTNGFSAGIYRDNLIVDLLVMGVNAGQAISALTPEALTPPWVNELTHLAGTTVTAQGNSRILQAGTTSPTGWIGNWTPGTPNTQTSVGLIVGWQQGLAATFVPNVVGMLRDAAWAAIDAAPLVRGTITYSAVAGTPLTVLSQSVAAGSWVVTTTLVHLTVVQPPPSPVPNVVTMTATAARTALEADNFIMEPPLGIYHPTWPTDTIISQTPAAGTSLAAGERVAVTLARGPEPPVAFPQLEGQVLGASGTATTSHVVTLPATVAPGNLLLICIGFNPNANTLYTSTGGPQPAPAGWNCFTDWTTAGFHRIADGTEGGTTVTIPTDVSCRSIWATFCISGQADSPKPFDWHSGSGGTPPNPSGVRKNVLWLSMATWRDTAAAPAYLTAYPIDVNMYVADQDYSASGPEWVGMLVGPSINYQAQVGPNPHLGVAQLRSPDTTYGLGCAVAQLHCRAAQLQYGNYAYSVRTALGAVVSPSGFSFGIRPLEVGPWTLPPLEDVYEQRWPVTKKNSGAFWQGEYWERAPEGTYVTPGALFDPRIGYGALADPDYPPILHTEFVKIITLDGRNVLVADGDPDYPNDWVTGDCTFFEFGQEPEDRTPFLPTAESGGSSVNPIDDGVIPGPETKIAGWFNAQAARVTLDYQFPTSGTHECWVDNPYCLPVNFAFPRSENGNFYIALDRWDWGGEDSWIDLRWNTWGFWFLDEYGMQFPKSVWGNKRVRFELKWKCGTANFRTDLPVSPETPPIAHVQTSVVGRTDGSTTVTTTFAVPPGVGHGIVVHVIGRTSAASLVFSPYAVTDSVGNVYDITNQQPYTNIGAATFYCPAVAVTGTPFTITVNAPVGTQGLTVCALEVDQPIDPDDDTHVTLSNTTNPRSRGLNPLVTSRHSFNTCVLVANASQSAMTHLGVSAADGVHTFTKAFTDLDNAHVVGECLWRTANPMVYPEGAEWTLTAPADCAVLSSIFWVREVAPDGWMELWVHNLDPVTARTVSPTRVLGGTDYWAPGPSQFDTKTGGSWSYSSDGVDPKYFEATLANKVSVVMNAAVTGRYGLVADSGGTAGSQPYAAFERYLAWSDVGRAVAKWKITSVPASHGNGTSIFYIAAATASYLTFQAWPTAGTGGSGWEKGIFVSGAGPTYRADFNWAPLVGTLATFRVEWSGINFTFYVNDVAVSWNKVDTMTPFTEHAHGTVMQHSHSGAYYEAPIRMSFANQAASGDMFTWALDEWYVEYDEAIADAPTSQLVSRVVGEPFIVGGDYHFERYGYPGPNYLCEMWLGYSGIAGPSEGFKIEGIAPVVPDTPEIELPDAGLLTWVEFTDSRSDVPVAVPSTRRGQRALPPAPSLRSGGVALTENFESYATRPVTNTADIGTWGATWAGIEAGTGRGGSKCAVSYQGAIQHYGLNIPTNRWGNTIVWNYRLSIAQLAARGHDSGFYRGINIQPSPASGGSGYGAGFGVRNDPGDFGGPEHNNSMGLWANHLDADGLNVPFLALATGVVVDSVWQKYEFRWKLSTVATGGIYLNPDGCAQLLVDDVLVIDETGLYLTLAPNTGPSILNQWESVYYAFGGLIDDIEVSTYGGLDALVCPEEATIVPVPPASTAGLSGIVHVWSKWDLPDRVEYYHGFKESRVVMWGQVSRALSGWDGQFEAAQFSWTISDSDLLLRRMLDSSTTRYFRNRPIVVRMIDDPSRRLELKPRTVVRGYISSYKAQSPLLFQFQSVDLLTAQYASVGVNDAQIPKRHILIADFPGIPADQVDALTGLGVPIIYGRVSDRETTTTTVPSFPCWDRTIPTGDPGDEMPNVRTWGGPQPDDSGDPTTLGRTYGPARAVYFYYIAMRGACGNYVPAYGGNMVPTAQWNWDELDGRVPLNYGAVFYWDHIDGIDKMRIYAGDRPDYDPLGGMWPGVGPTVGTCTHLEYVEFDNTTKWAAEPWDKDYGWMRWGEITQPEATLVNVLTQPPTTVSVDSGKGEYVPMYVGIYDLTPYLLSAGYDPAGSVGMSYHAWLVAGHAVKEIEDLYIGDTPLQIQTNATKAINVGAPWLVPGYAEHDRIFGHRYRVINGHRYTIIYGRTTDPQVSLAAGVDPPEGTTPLPENTKPFAINVKGIETDSDGTGTLITDIFKQYFHFMVNWIMGSYQDGVWLTTPVYQDEPTLPLIAEDSFLDCSDIAKVRLRPDGYVGAGIIGYQGEITSVRDVIARWNLSADCDSGYDRWTRFFVSITNDLVENPTEVSALNDVIENTLDVDDNVGQHANIVPFDYRQNLTGVGDAWLKTLEVQDPVSMEKYRVGEISGTFRAAVVEMWYVRSDAVAANIASNRLARQTYPPRLVRFTVPINVGANIDLGDVVALTHFGGIGESGYVRRPMRIVRHELDPENFITVLECYDLGDVFYERRMILGDNAALQPTWTDAEGTADREYGYLADRDNGMFSDMKRGKKL